MSETSEDVLSGLILEDDRLRVISKLIPTAGLGSSSAELEGEVRQRLRQGDKRAALRLAVRGVRSWPASGGLWRSLSLTLRRVGRVDEAAAAARTAIDLEPWHSDGRAALAWSLEQLGRRQEAMTAWQEVLAQGASGHVDDAQRRLARLRALSEAQGWPAPVPRARITGALSVTVGPAVRIDTGGGTAQAAEVSLAATDDGELVAAWNDLREAGTDGEWRLGWATSGDGGLSWSDDVLRPPGALPENFEGDPMTAFDPRTGTLWVGGTQFFGDELYLSRRLDGVPDFSPPAILVEQPLLDRAQLAVGVDPSSPSATLLHIAHLQGLQTSADLGDTWSPILTWEEFGFAHHPATGLDGELYATYSDFGDRIVLQRSLDGGATLEPAIQVAVRRDTWDTQNGSRFPGQFRVAPLPFLASSPVDGTLYCLYFDTTEVIEGQANVDLYLTVSGDRGESWSPPRVVNGDGDPPGDQFLPWIEVDDAGRIHLVFFDTRNTPQLDDVVDARIDVYHSVSADLGASWTETRLTSEPFGTAVISWPSSGSPQFLGDYLGLATAGGRTWVAYPTTENGDLDLYVREIFVGDLIFADGFESGDTSAWSDSKP